MASDPRRKRRRLKRDVRRQKILKAARWVLAARGYSGTTLDQVAKRAGITRAVVYRHFGDRDELLQEVADTEMRYLITAVTPALRQQTLEPLAQEGASRLLAYVDANREGFIAVVGHTPISWNTDTTVNGYRQKINRLTSVRLRKMLPASEKQFAPILAHTILAIGLNFAIAWIENPAEVDLGRESAIEVLTRMVVGVVRPYMSAEGRRA